MYLIVFFGFLLMLLSIVMIASPGYWASGIVKFSEKSYFHPFEILSRLAFGAAFIVSADQTLYPTLTLIIGYLLLTVGVGLLLTPPSKHKQFAVWSARRFKHSFRPMGVVSLFFGAFLVYVALPG